MGFNSGFKGLNIDKAVGKVYHVFSFLFGNINKESLDLAILNVAKTQIYLKICVKCC